MQCIRLVWSQDSSIWHLHPLKLPTRLSLVLALAIQEGISPSFFYGLGLIFLAQLTVSQADLSVS